MGFSESRKSQPSTNLQETVTREQVSSAGTGTHSGVAPRDRWGNDPKQRRAALWRRQEAKVCS